MSRAGPFSLVNSSGNRTRGRRDRLYDLFLDGSVHVHEAGVVTVPGVITRVAVLPHPPLLIPELTVRSTTETEQLRSACLRAVSSLTHYATEWVAVGVDRAGPTVLTPESKGTFAGFGADVPVALGAGGSTRPEHPMPLPALIAGWLRGQVELPELTVYLLAPDSSPETALRKGSELAATDTPRGLLVFADGSNRRNEQSPHAPDARAPAFDEAVGNALANADRDWLRALEPALAAELGVDDRAALQFLAGATSESGGTWHARLHYSATPYGVTYHVAVWERHETR